MEEGQTYYKVQLDAAKMAWEAQKAMKEGRDKVFSAVFLNTDKKSEKSPALKNEWMALWKTQKGANNSYVSVEDVQ